MNTYFLTTVIIFLSLQEITYTTFIENFHNSSSENFIPCERGWYYFGRKCYKVEGYEGSNASLSWNDARERCLDLGGHLLSIHSKEEKDFIKVLLASLKIHENIHTGLFKGKQEYFFEWEDGSEIKFIGWKRGDYNRYSVLGTMEFRTHPYPEKAGELIPVYTSHQRPYICKKGRNDSISSPDPIFCSSEEGAGFRFQDSCYNIINEKLSWNDAEKFCQNISSGHLVKIMDKEHGAFLNYMLAGSKGRRWIGIKIQDELHQKWSSGFPIVYDNLEESFKDLIEGMCVIRWKENIWTHAPCVEKYPFICEVSREDTPFSPLPSQEYRCPNLHHGWIDLGGEFCYYFETKSTLSFYDAQYECMRKGGILASILSKEVEDELRYYVKSHRTVYIGLNSLYTSGSTFIWSDGRHVNYSHWAPDEPNMPSEMCVELWVDNMVWNDILCTLKRRFICQVEKVQIFAEKEEEDCEECEIISSKSYTSPPSHLTWYVLCIALSILGVMLGSAIYISRKWLKKKQEQILNVQFKKSASYKEFPNAHSVDLLICSKQ